MTTYTTAQIEKANKIAMTSKMPMDQILASVAKQDLRNAPKQMASKDIQKAESRSRIENGEVNTDFDFAERMRENARKNMPSSMR